MEPDPDEILARLRAAADQAKAGMTEVAEALGVYNSALLAAGFRREEAVMLCISYQEFILMQGAASAQEGGGGAA